MCPLAFVQESVDTDLEAELCCLRDVLAARSSQGAVARSEGRCPPTAAAMSSDEVYVVMHVSLSDRAFVDEVFLSIRPLVRRRSPRTCPRRGRLSRVR